MSKETTPNAVELLNRLATLLHREARNLQHNRFDRKRIQSLLLEYAARAESDGRLMNASRQHARCVDHGVFLAHTHLELLDWLAKHNYTVPVSAVKWYSWRKVASRKHRLPSVFVARRHASELRDLLGNVVEKAELLYADLRANEVEIPAVAIDYRQVTPQESLRTPPEALNELLERGVSVEAQLRDGK
ncbi:glyoxalase family protein [Aspergillus lucknowensis]|uniref:Uncharacterized protein n=1 Tax=Aspergillus lucknowensis TaxID=176173 RepID=A0ABR4LY97_9EURO